MTVDHVRGEFACLFPGSRDVYFAAAEYPVRPGRTGMRRNYHLSVPER